MLSFDTPLPSLENADYMFQSCSGLKTFYGYEDLGSLRSAIGMFKNCRSLTSFECDIPYLRVANEMFYYCRSLSSFCQDLGNLVTSDRMFERCKNLNRIKSTSDMHSLVSAREMFKDCFQYGYSSYYSYSYGGGQYDFDGGVMSNLLSGENMFQNCYRLTSMRAAMTALEIGENMFRGLRYLKVFTDYGLNAGTSNFSYNLGQVPKGN